MRTFDSLRLGCTHLIHACSVRPWNAPLKGQPFHRQTKPSCTSKESPRTFPSKIVFNLPVSLLLLTQNKYLRLLASCPKTHVNLLSKAVGMACQSDHPTSSKA